MMDEQEALLSTKEVADYLGVTITTVYQYVKNNKLRPVYEDWTIDETMLFYKSDLEQLKSQRPTGYTTSQVANKLGVHQTTIAKKIKEGNIKAEKIFYRGRMTYFIQQEELEKLIITYGKKQKENTKFYHPKYELYLYQSIINDSTGEFGRVMDISRDGGTINTESGDNIDMKDMKDKGYRPKERFQSRNYFNRAGYVNFKFNMPFTINSSVYDAIELLYNFAGHKNIRLSTSNNVISIYVKPVLIKSSLDFFSIFNENIVSGEVIKRHNGIFLNSGFEHIQLDIISDIKNKYEKLAKAKGISVKKYLEEAINSGRLLD